MTSIIGWSADQEDSIWCFSQTSFERKQTAGNMKQFNHLHSIIALTFAIVKSSNVSCFTARPMKNKVKSTHLYNTNNVNQEQNREEKRVQERIIDQLFCPQTPVSIYSKTRPMMELSFAGIGNYENKNSKNPKRTCIFLTPVDYLMSNKNANEAFPAIAIPLSSSRSNSLSTGRRPTEKSLLQLLQSAYQNQPMSKSKCLIVNSILVNRDNSLFDNTPWSRWTIGNHTYDAAGNPISEKYHFGKRDAYNRFLGKDWPGRSLSIGNLAQKLLYLLEGDEPETFDGEEEETTLQQLSIRILELEIQELKEQLAELQQQWAIFQQTDSSDISTPTRKDDLQDMIQSYQSELEKKQHDLYQKQHPDENKPIYEQSPSSILSQILNSIVDKSDTVTPPYRGAYGFSPLIDSKIQMLQQSILPYRHPYDLLLEIIEEQLYGKVIGCVLEDTWIYDENAISLGGACVLQRQREKKTVNIAGEEITIYEDEEDDNGVKDINKINDEIKGGQVQIVECDADEVIGLALATGSRIQLSKQYWEDLNILVTRNERQDIQDPLSNITLPTFAEIIVVDDKPVVMQDENSQNLNPSEGIRIPKTTSGFFFNDNNNSNNNNNNNPSEETSIESLNELDSLSNPEKAQILSSLESFQRSNIQLPRPRTLQSSPTLLTDLLLPYIDESVRRQFKIRQAKQNNDYDLVQILENEKSNRQKAQEMAQSTVNPEDQVYYEEESEFYKSIRADVTQDEGSYSRFLDKDDWYERDRLKRAQNVKKSDFGTLLDGIE